MNNLYENKYLKYKAKYIALKNTINNNKINMLGGSINQTEKTLTLIKADWCGHCKKFFPIWEELPKHLPNINFKVLDSEQNKDEIQKYKIAGYPSIFLEIDNKIIEYTGGRTVEDIKNFLEIN